MKLEDRTVKRHGAKRRMRIRQKEWNERREKEIAQRGRQHERLREANVDILFLELLKVNPLFYPRQMVFQFFLGKKTSNGEPTNFGRQAVPMAYCSHC